MAVHILEVKAFLSLQSLGFISRLHASRVCKSTKDRVVMRGKEIVSPAPNSVIECFQTQDIRGFSMGEDIC